MRLMFFCAAMLAVVSADVRAVDENQPYGRACVAVVGASQGAEAPFTTDSKPGEQTRIVVHLDANQPCVAVVAAFATADGKLANGWRPAFLPLEEWDERIVPPGGDSWAWAKESEAFEVLVAFLPKAAASAEKWELLVGKLGEASAEPAVLKLLSRQLRDEMRKSLATQASLPAQPETAPTRIGGTVRAAGGTLAWRDFSKKVSFSEQAPGVIAFRHGGQ